MQDGKEAVVERNGRERQIAVFQGEFEQILQEVGEGDLGDLFLRRESGDEKLKKLFLLVFDLQIEMQTEKILARGVVVDMDLARLDQQEMSGGDGQLLMVKAASVLSAGGNDQFEGDVDMACKILAALRDDLMKIGEDELPGLIGHAEGGIADIFDLHQISFVYSQVPGTAS